MSLTFVSSLPSTQLSSATPVHFSSSFCRRPSTTRNAVVRRAHNAASISMMNTSNDKFSRFTERFTGKNEKLNGRAAMMGFVLAMITEAITGQGIVGQLKSIPHIFEITDQFSQFVN